MSIRIAQKDIIPMQSFELKWRWAKPNNNAISDSEVEFIEPLSKSEARRLNGIVSEFERNDNLNKRFVQTDWMAADIESDEKIEKFRNQISALTKPWNERVIVIWDATTVLRTTKEVFVRYWDDFCYPGSDDVTIISEKKNWIMHYHHMGAATIWLKRNSR